MNKTGPIRALFAFAALYDGILGALFLAAPGAPFRWFDVTPPNHLGYIQFPALLLLMFAVMFVQVARDPGGNRHLIPYGIWLKATYCGLAFYYWMSTDIPMIWKPFAVIDLVMGVLFVWAWQVLRWETHR